MPKPRTSAALSFLLAGGLIVASLACANEAPTPDRHAPKRGRNPRAAADASKAPATDAKADKAPATVADDYPMMVRLVGRHQSIVVTAGPKGRGPLYTAERNDGTLIVAGATLDELRKDHPEVYHQLIPTIAAPAKSVTSKRKDQDKKEDVADASRGPVSSSRPESRVGLMMSADR